MRYSDMPAHLTQGFRALKVIELPLATQPHGIQKDTPEQVEARGDSPVEKIMVGIRALNPEERSEVLSLAYSRAVSKGATGDVEKSAAYQLELAVATVGIAAVDPSSDRRRPILFFGDTLAEAVETIRKSPLMTDDIVLYLRERQEAFQDEVSPQALTVRDNELYDIAKKAVDDEDFLHFFRPGLLVKFSRTMAALVLSSLEGSYGDSSTLKTSGESLSEKQPKMQRKGKQPDLQKP